VLRIVQPDFRRLRVPLGADKSRLLRAVDRARGVACLPRLLRLIGLSPSRLAAWRRAAIGCRLDDTPSCPHGTPHRLAQEEVNHIRDMVTSPAWRHVPVGRLATLAQRLGRVFASAATWHRLVRERGWRRPRLRLDPGAPREGIRADAPNGLWHIDTTVIRLLDGTRAFAQAVIDNFSRRILAWRVTDRIDAGTSVDLLLEAGTHLPSDGAATAMADQGVENCNAEVDALVEAGILRRVLAQVDLAFSNSLIEAWWRSLKHGWLFLHPLENVTQVRRLVGFYVEQHNTHMPHSAFQGQTPDEMYFGTGAQVPDQLAERRARAREERLAANRAKRCAVCA
jgi:transposase InsO family protein